MTKPVQKTEAIPIKQRVRKELFDVAAQCGQAEIEIDQHVQHCNDTAARTRFFIRQQSHITGLLESFDDMEPQYVNVVFDTRASDNKKHFQDIQHLKRDRKLSKTAV